jgi:beta-glucosidase
MEDPVPNEDLQLFADAVERVRVGASLDAEAAALVDAMTDDEMLGVLDGDSEFWAGLKEMSEQYNARPVVMGEVPRIGLPGLRFSDGPRGVVMGESTAFPVSMARGATWDLELEERIGRAIGAEMRAQDANFFGGVCINLPRHPAWGRVQETYGEDSYLLGEFGAALVRGIQRHAMAVAKHYALNSMENARFRVDVTADDATLQEVYLPHFRRVVEEGVDGIMSSYNSVNGEWAGQNETLLEGILRDQWGFAGVTVSDFIFGLRDAALSVHAGLDVESPFRQQRAEHLPQALAAGTLSWDDVRRAARRSVRAQLRYAASDLDPEPAKSVVFSPEHRALAREAAAASMVLLKNEAADGAALLPLDATRLTSIALIGRLANIANTGDAGSSDVHSPEVATVLDGLTAALPDARIALVTADDPDAAAAAAASADAAIVVVGYTSADEGEFLGDEMMTSPTLLALFPPQPENADQPGGGAVDTNDIVMGGAKGGDRLSLRLRQEDVANIRAVSAVNPRTIVAIVTAGAVIIEEWKYAAPAILLSWYAGSEGGHALADVLLGKVDAGGRLPYSIPTDESHLPAFDRDAESVVYDRWHGQRLLDRDGHPAAFPLGFGMSYSTFAIGDLRVVSTAGEDFAVVTTVTNTGDRDGRHVVQLYGVVDADDFPSRVLLGFAPVHLAPGERRDVTIHGSTRPVQRWTDGGFVPAADVVRLEASAFSGDPDAATTTLTIHDMTIHDTTIPKKSHT